MTVYYMFCLWGYALDVKPFPSYSTIGHFENESNAFVMPQYPWCYDEE